jgi:hypothetical protein
MRININTIKRTKLEGKLRQLQANREMFTAQFIKINGDIRQITAFVSGASNAEQDHFDYITVYDIFEQGFRTLNLATVEQICFHNKTYLIMD